MTHEVLVIEPEPRFLDALVSDFPAHYQQTSWGAFEPEQMRFGRIDLVVAVGMPDTSALSGFFEWVRTHKSASPIFGVLPQAAPEPLIRAASQILDDFILWPAPQPELKYRIGRLLGTPSPRAEEGLSVDAREPALRRLIGENPVFRQAIDRIPRIADTDAPVLITGETGTGKELAARAIHQLSRRGSGPFIPVDCSALPELLFENEMFGHERGAFTDAHRRRDGLVALAQGGTLFLDEIDSLGLGVQAKLLRLLQEKTYRPLGSERFLHADVRVLAASNRDLEESVARKQLRSDLFFRLDVLRLHLPPLRERDNDIAVLAGAFLQSLATPDGSRKTLSPGALRKLSLHPWPGNVRELWTVLQRAVVFASGSQISAQDIALPGADAAWTDCGRPFRAVRAEAVAAFEKGYVDDLLRRHSGNVTRAAREAKHERRSFGRLVKKYGLRPAAL